jgi:hypothetical protein
MILMVNLTQRVTLTSCGLSYVYRQIGSIYPNSSWEHSCTILSIFFITKLVLATFLIAGNEKIVMSNMVRSIDECTIALPEIPFNIKPKILSAKLGR